jgi:L-lactate dehydrogenase complex protein LldG
VSARARILGRLRSARTGSRVPRVEAPASVAEPHPEATVWLPRFEVEAQALGVECYVEASLTGVHTRLASLIDGRRVLSWHPEHLPYHAARVVIDPILGVAARSQLASAAVGVTGCDAAVAETASLVLFSGPGRSRAVSLLPPFHIALVERAKIHFSMADVFETYRERLRASASCTFITGPSRTADIELTLTLGIHGPGRVAVIVGP